MIMKVKFLSAFLLIAFLFSLPAAAGQAQELTETPRPPEVAQTAGFNVTVDSSSKSGQPGAVIFYQVTVSNDTGADLNVSVPDPESTPGWPVSVDFQGFALANGAQKTILVTVAVPGASADGDMNVTTVRFSDGVTELGNIVLTTTASKPQPTIPGRPLIVLDSYGVSGDQVTPGQEFELRLTVVNRGQDYARNVVLTFGGSDFLPVGTGGVRALNEVDPGEKVNVFQRLIASSSLSGQSVATTSVTVAYSDLSGSTQYTETLTITINLVRPQTGGPARPTATPTAINRAQLVVSSYSADIDPLQPGSIFNLNLEIRNLGNADARSVTMVLGGGVTTNESGTPVPGGSELSTFAPLGASNLVYIGDIPAGATVTNTQHLIVNVSANPGAYAFKLSFVFDDEKGARLINDQVITMLIYQLPQLEISYYRDPGSFFTNQPNMLPLQVTNLGRKTAVLGNMRVVSSSAEVSNNVTFVGALEPGGYFTLDAMVMPYQPGPLDLEVSISYTDDFNQPRVVTQTLSVDVMEMPVIEEPIPGQEGGFPPDGGMAPGGEETLWQKILRFFKGLLGLDSALPEPAAPSEPMPVEPMPGEGIPAPVRPKG